MEPFPPYQKMGRYAFFNTGVEYKFSVAVQDSQDIWEFGGEQDFEGYNETGYAHHSWSAEEDAARIVETLKQIEAEEDYPALEFEAFSKDDRGTWELQYHLSGYLSRENAAHCFYELGCILYHQLLYEPELTVRYEI